MAVCFFLGTGKQPLTSKLFWRGLGLSVGGPWSVCELIRIEKDKHHAAAASVVREELLARSAAQMISTKQSEAAILQTQDFLSVSNENGDRTHLEAFFAEYGFNLKQTEIVDGLASVQYRFKAAPKTSVKQLLGLNKELLLGAQIDGLIDVISGYVTVTARKSQGDRRFVTLENHPFPECPNPKGCCFLLGYNDLTSEPIIVDLTSPNHPHALVGGTTGGGKTITIISWLISMMHWYSPEHLKFLILDPKGDYSPDGKASLADFVDCRYMLRPNVRDVEDGLCVLRWVIEEMNKRQTAQKNPYQLVVLIDEFADYMRPPDLKDESARLISELAAKARSSGIHLIVCTQYPLAEIIPTHISGNLPLKVGLKMDKNEKALPVLGEPYPMKHLLGQGHGVTIIPGEGLQQFQSLYATRDELLNVMGQPASAKSSEAPRNFFGKNEENPEDAHEASVFDNGVVVDIEAEAVKNNAFDWQNPYDSYSKIIDLINLDYSKTRIMKELNVKFGENKNYKEFNKLYNTIMEVQNNANTN